MLRFIFRVLIIFVLFVEFTTFLPAQPSGKTALPRVVLVGDSIRLGYAPLVASALKDKVQIISPPGAGDSAWLLKNLDKFIIEAKPDIVHFNVGLHDLRFQRKSKTFQVDIDTYQKNLNTIVDRLKKETKATLLFTSTTPIDDAKHAKRGGGYDRFEKDVLRYNRVALEVMRRHGLVVHDLHALVKHYGTDKMHDRDGTHYTTLGKNLQARAVTDCILRHLAVRNARPGKVPEPTAEAGERYRKAEAERDAEVPAFYKKWKVPAFTPPVGAEQWKKDRSRIKEIVVGTLGDLPKRPKPSAILLAREIHPAFILESLRIPNGVGDQMTALMLTPHKQAKSAPAILWLHSSSYDRHQLLMRGYNGGEEPLGEVLVRTGYVVLAPDASWYGGRAGVGPSGATETTRTQQETMLKFDLWMGRTLWGMFVHDDQCALDYLCSRPEVDVKRIGATGMSMGSTRSWWLAAVDERIACTVGVACLTRYQNLIAHGQLRQHGVYYFVNGLLKHFDIEAVLALIAPRPYLALTGDLDAGSPADGIRVIEAQLNKVYTTLEAKERFRSVIYKNTGHVYSQAMRKEMLQWMNRWLKPKSN